MFRRILLGSVALLASASIVSADAQSDVKAAADKLKAAPNFSFNVTTANAQAPGGGGGGGRRGGFGGGPFQGKTEKDGYTWISTMGRGGMVTEVLMKGDKMAIKMGDTWQTPDEMAAAGGGGGGGRGGFNPTARYTTMKDTMKTAMENIDKLTNFQAAGDAITADMPDDVAKAAAMPNFGGGRGGAGGGGGGGAAAGGGGGGFTPPTVSNAKGTEKFTLKDGVISKIETHLTGTMTGQNGDMPIDRTTTIDITDVGSTKIDVPDDVAKKLNS